MKVRKGFLAMGLAAALLTAIIAAPRTDAATRVIVRPGVGFAYGPGPAYYWGAGYAHAPVYGYVPARPHGDVKINAGVKGESIFVDGEYAGVTGKLKKFPLQPGNHQIEVRDASGQVLFQNTVRVIAGQTVNIDC
jgi:hypothetical protein